MSSSRFYLEVVKKDVWRIRDLVQKRKVVGKIFYNKQTDRYSSISSDNKLNRLHSTRRAAFEALVTHSMARF